MPYAILPPSSNQYLITPPPTGLSPETQSQATAPFQASELEQVRGFPPTPLQDAQAQITQSRAAQSVTPSLASRVVRAVINPLTQPLAPAQQTRFERGVNTVVDAAQKVMGAPQQAVEKFATNGLGFEQFLRRSGVPESLVGPTSIALRTFTDPTNAAFAAIPAIRATRAPLALETPMVKGVATAAGYKPPSAEQIALSVRDENAVNAARAQYNARFGRPALPATAGSSFGGPIATPLGAPVEPTLTAQWRNAQPALPANVARPMPPFAAQFSEPSSAPGVQARIAAALGGERYPPPVASTMAREPVAPQVSAGTTAAETAATLRAQPSPPGRTMFSTQRAVRPEDLPSSLLPPGARPVVRPPATPTEIPADPQRIMFPIGGAARTQTVTQAQSPRTILNRIFPAEQLGEKAAQADAAEARIVGPRTVDLRQAGLPKLTVNEDRSIFQALEGRGQAISRRAQQVVDQTRQIYVEDAKYYIDSGAKVVNEPILRDANGVARRVIQERPFVPELDPSFWRDFTAKNPILQIPALAKYGKEPWRLLDGGIAESVLRINPTMNPAAAQQIEQTLISSLKTGMKDALDQGLGRYASRFTDPRGIVNADVQVATRDIMRLNPGLSAQDAVGVVEAMRARALGQPIPSTVPPTIVQRLNSNAFLPTHLHARSDINLPDYFYRPMKEAIPLYLDQAARERGFLEAFGTNADKQVEQLIAQRGPRDPQVRLAAEVWDAYRGRFLPEESSRRMSQVARILNNTATALLIGPQTSILHLSQFIPSTAKLGALNMIKGLGEVLIHGGLSSAERAGAFVNSLSDELARFSPLMPTATGVDRIERITSQAAGAVVRYSGIRTIVQFPRAVAYHAAQFALEDAQRAAVFGNTKALGVLKYAGITPAATAEEISQAASAISRRLNFAGSRVELPYFMQKPWGQFFRGLNVFHTRAAQTVYQDFLVPATKGDVGPLAKLLTGSAVGGEAIGELRRWYEGRPGDRPGGTTTEFVGDLLNGKVPTHTVLARVTDELSWSGSMSFLNTVWQSVKFSQGGTFGAESMARLGRHATGAGVSNILETIGAGGQALLTLPSLATGTDQEQQTAQRHLATAGRVLTRRVPEAGGFISNRLFPSEVTDQRIAAEGAGRAINRGDQETAMQWQRWFYQRHQKYLSPAVIQKALP